MLLNWFRSRVSHWVRAWWIVTWLAWAAVLYAQPRPRVTSPTAELPRVTSTEIVAHLRFLASDLLEGRGATTRGGRITVQYLETQLRAFGLGPGASDTSYIQPVPIAVAAIDTASVRASVSGAATAALVWGQDLLVHPTGGADSAVVRGELVVVGFGLSAPAAGWDDYGGVNVHGKIVLLLSPFLPPTDGPSGWHPDARHPLWTTTIEGRVDAAKRHGAAAVALLVPTGDPWTQTRTFMVHPSSQLDGVADGPGWEGATLIALRDSTVASLMARAGLDLDTVRARSARRGFRAVPTGITLDLQYRNEVEHRTSANVIGIVRGSDARLRDHAVVITAHWDGFGIGKPVNGDSIYNGAEDNASGTALVLGVARALAGEAREGETLRRSIVIIFTGAEELGMLGARWYVAHPTVTLDRIDAEVNEDGENVWGRTRDIVGRFETESSLGPLLRAVAGAQHLRVTPDPALAKGWFFRSDGAVFAKAGVPTITIDIGTDFVGQPAAWYKEQQDANSARMHTPSDEYRRDWDLAGAAQQAEVLRAFALAVANQVHRPVWNENAEFEGRRNSRSMRVTPQ